MTVDQRFPKSKEGPSEAPPLRPGPTDPRQAEGVDRRARGHPCEDAPPDRGAVTRPVAPAPDARRRTVPDVIHELSRIKAIRRTEAAPQSRWSSDASRSARRSATSRQCNFKIGGVIHPQIVLTRQIEEHGFVMIVVDRDTHLLEIGERRSSIRCVETATPFVDREGTSEQSLSGLRSRWQPIDFSKSETLQTGAREIVQRLLRVFRNSYHQIPGTTAPCAITCCIARSAIGSLSSARHQDRMMELSRTMCFKIGVPRGRCRSARQPRSA